MLLDYKLSNGCNIYAGIFCGCNKGTGKQISVKMKDCLKSLTCVIFLTMNLVQSHKRFIFRSNSKHLIVTIYIIIRDFTSIWLQLIWQGKLIHDLNSHSFLKIWVSILFIPESFSSRDLSWVLGDFTGIQIHCRQCVEDFTRHRCRPTGLKSIKLY